MTDIAFNPKEIRYIKLGPGGAWASESIESGVIPLGYSDIDHALCAAADWDAVRSRFITAGKTARGASQGVRELRDFYELDDQTLWVALARGHLWWTFANGPVELPDRPVEAGPSRIRRTQSGWRCSSLVGEPLTVRTLSSALTKVGSYQMTICNIEARAYLLRRIRGEADALHLEARSISDQMCRVAVSMIRQLHWEEFETLVDLIFARSGWRRVSALGGGQPDVDLVLDQPTTGETAWVQVKTGARQSQLNDYLERFRRDGSCSRFFFVCGNPSSPLHLAASPNTHLWVDDALAKATINVGLFDWLIERTQ